MAEQRVQRKFVDPKVVVETDWLGDQFDDTAIVLIDVRSPQSYRQGHIPGAVNLPIFLLLSPAGGAPDSRQIAARLGRAGIQPDSKIVAYDDGGSLMAAQLFWILTYLGHPNISVLNGGAAKWTIEERAWSRDVGERIPVEYVHMEGDAVALAQMADVQSGLGADDVVILDVRSQAEYHGFQPTASRNGHIPGAVNIDWELNMVADEDGAVRLRDDQELRRLYEGVGVTRDKQVVVHCHSGVRSCETFLVLKKLGYPSVANYVAGWQEWGNRRDTPVEME